MSRCTLKRSSLFSKLRSKWNLFSVDICFVFFSFVLFLITLLFFSLINVVENTNPMNEACVFSGAYDQLLDEERLGAYSSAFLNFRMLSDSLSECKNGKGLKISSHNGISQAPEIFC